METVQVQMSHNAEAIGHPWTGSPGAKFRNPWPNPSSDKTSSFRTPSESSIAPKMAEEMNRRSPANENVRTAEEETAVVPVNKSDTADEENAITDHASNEKETALAAESEIATAKEETAPASNEEDEEVNPGLEDSDLEDGDQVILRGYPRNDENLEKHGFRPVWAGSYPYKEIPEDIKEYLDEDGSCDGVWMIGPLKSIAWLAGLDDLVEEIDSPAYTVQDEIVWIPNGTGLMWPLRQLIDDGLISERTRERVPFGRYPDTIPQNLALGHDKSPAGVSDRPALFPLNQITGACRLQRPSGQILCMKINSQKNGSILETKIRRQAEGRLESENLWFRGLSLGALRSTLALFIPQVNSGNSDNEFGPGFYTTNSLTECLKYIRGGTGAIMVFEDPDLTSVWEPTGAERNAWVTRWTSSQRIPPNPPVPSQYATADFIEGLIGQRRESPRTTGTRPATQAENTQLVAVSSQGCKTLANSLSMIIFVDPR